MTSDITGATNNGITDSDLCSSSEETGSSSQTIDIYQSTESTKKVSPVDNNEELEVIPRPTNSDRTDGDLHTKENTPKRFHVDAATLGLIPLPEGGYFREIYRSGCTPMTSRGQSDFNVATQITRKIHIQYPQQVYTEPLSIAPGRENRRPDGDIRRNCLTTIIWMPTRQTPSLLLSKNLSDHVHFYQGGASFEYIMYDPVKGVLLREVLGANFLDDKKLQVACPGGIWKCGRLSLNDDFDYCLIGEAVAPGFDFHDFSWVTKSEIMSLPNKEHQQILLQFLHDDIEYLSGKEVEEAVRYYDKHL